MPPGEHSPGDNPGQSPHGDEPDGAVMVEHLLWPGDPAPRTHPADHDRYAYVVEGQVAARVGPEILVVGPGSIVSIPRGFHHSLHSAGDSIARVQVLHLPAPGPASGQDRHVA
jgi:quercetin dioxygenase-like cupin family protein